MGAKRQETFILTKLTILVVVVRGLTEHRLASVLRRRSSVTAHDFQQAGERWDDLEER